jgi:hypothetical protein
MDVIFSYPVMDHGATDYTIVAIAYDVVFSYPVMDHGATNYTTVAIA